MSPIGGIKISNNIFSAILKSFTNIGQSNPEVATKLINAGLADTVYGILIIDLLVEFLPPLPKYGVFDPELAQPTAVNSEGPNIEQEKRATLASSKVNVAPTLDGDNWILPYLSSTEGIKPEDCAGAVAPSAASFAMSIIYDLQHSLVSLNPAGSEHLDLYNVIRKIDILLQTIVRIYNFKPMMDMLSLLNPSIYEQSIVNHEDISEYGSDFDMNQSSLGDSKCSTLHITNITKNIGKHEIEERFLEAGSLHRAFLLPKLMKL
ncbi:hypothetical protein BY996DRAFT_8553367 [Phakopsora pachyrhizi]|nr:hypothetical protein BY996DRAFT_8553367 [Phakopsora pachyrhizi]